MRKDHEEMNKLVDKSECSIVDTKRKQLEEAYTEFYCEAEAGNINEMVEWFEKFTDIVGFQYSKCPKCGMSLSFEDHSSVGGSKDYWSCGHCGEEQDMFSIQK